MGQMNLSLELPDSIKAQVEIIRVWNVDSSKVVFKESFNGKVININLEFEETTLDPVLKYIVFAGGSAYESFFPGELDSVAINLETRYVSHKPSNKFYSLTEMINGYRGDTLHRYAIIQEIARLFKAYPDSEYLQYILYNSVKNNLISQEEFFKNFVLPEAKGPWLLNLKNFLSISGAQLSEYFDTLNRFTSIHDFVLLKFWGTWCKPCIEDDKKIMKLQQCKEFIPFIVGIQNDKRPSNKDVAYFNILDRDNVLTSYYRVSAFPTYILLKNGTMVINTNSLTELLKYFN